MKRNSDRIWFDEGYRQGVRRQRVRNFTPKLFAYWSILVTTYFYPSIALTFLVLYTGYEFLEHRDRKSEEVREPPETWESE